MRKIIILFMLLSLVVLSSCGVKNSDNSIEVILNSPVYITESYIRIPYSLKMWEYEKENLFLEKIEIFDAKTKKELMIINEEELPYIYKNPLEQNGYFAQDELESYYTSIQIPIPIDRDIPEEIIHKFIFRDSTNMKEKVIETALFKPLKHEKPLRIASPLIGKNIVLVAQNSMDYHFNTMFFKDKKIYTGERFAFDSLKVDEDNNIFNGDPALNTSYYNYGDIIYAAADGIVVTVRDGRPENNGNLFDLELKDADELGGNYLTIEMDKYYFHYAHCITNSIMVKEGDAVKKGQPLALLGNSGNSAAPHLHFQITEGKDILFSKGVPFILENYIKTGDVETGEIMKLEVSNSNVEETSIIEVKTER